MNFSFFFAKKLYGYKGDKKQVSLPAMRIATMGVAVGLAVMIIAVSVVLGFKQEIRSKVLGMGAHIEVLNINALSTPESHSVVIDSALLSTLYSISNISHIQRFSYKTGMLKTDSAFLGMMLKGVEENYDTTFLHNHLVAGSIPILNQKSSNQILISQMMADDLNLKVGDRIYAYFFEQSMKIRRFHVSGIYRTNMAQFDKNIIITDLQTVNQLNKWKLEECSGAEIYTKNYDDIIATATQINKQIGAIEDKNGNTYATFTIEELYPQVFEWLKLLDLNVWVILILMIAVASFTMVSGLLILILERTTTIGMLKAMGATNTTIRSIFLHYASFIIGRGLLWGNILGIGLVFIQGQWGVMQLNPETYYVDAVPVLFNVGLIILLNVSTLLLSLLALIVPSFLISRIQPAKAIRFD